MVYFSKWLKADFPDLFAQITSVLSKHGEQYGLLEHTKDYWCRDYMPIPLSDGRYLQYRYAPDYLAKKPQYQSDPKPICDALGLECVETDIVLDGGNVVHCGDKVVMIDKIFCENPHYTPTELISELECLLDAQLVLMPWDRAEKYGHSDGVVRYLGEGKVLLTNYQDYDNKMYYRFREILEKHFQVETLSYTNPDSTDSSWAYINFLQTPNVIILPRFGTHKDAQAFDQILKHFPEYKGRIESVDASKIIKKGGALNCLSWN